MTLVDQSPYRSAQASYQLDMATPIYAQTAAERELREETGLAAIAEAGVEVVEYVSRLTEEPADRPSQYDPSVAQVNVTCFHVTAPDEWEPNLDWEHDDHRWYDPGDAFGFLRWPATAQALRRAPIAGAKLVALGRTSLPGSALRNVLELSSSNHEPAQNMPCDGAS